MFNSPTAMVFLIKSCFSSSSINSKQNFWGVPHLLPMRDFLIGQVTFVGYIGCNVPFWNFFSDILELVVYSECYCFVIPIIILHCVFI